MSKFLEGRDAMGRDAYGRELNERPRATAAAALEPQRFQDRALNASELEQVASEARYQGSIGALVAGLCSGAAVVTANMRSARFRNALGVSGKVALIVTPTAGAFFLRSHQTVGSAIENPDSVVGTHASLAANPAAAAPVSSHATHATNAIVQLSLSPLQRLANLVYDNPFKTIIAIAAPIYGGLFYRESTHASTREMLLSQRLIHTRVYGQFVAVLSTVTIMGFCETMRAGGGAYRIADGKLVRGDQAPTRLRNWYSADTRTEAEVRWDVENQRLVAEAEGNRRDGLDLMVPLLYAPLLPLMRLGLRGYVHVHVHVCMRM